MVGGKERPMILPFVFVAVADYLLIRMALAIDLFRTPVFVAPIHTAGLLAN